MKKYILPVALLMIPSLLAAQPEARKLIDKLCGCFQADFRYAETFSPDPNYTYHEREETGGTAELALPIEVTDRKMVIQHLLIVGPQTVVKHWREEWSYEENTIWQYKGDRVWIKKYLPEADVKGKWTQTVWEVADEPRYQGISAFAEVDGKIIWQHTTDAPLPRREYSVRNDYNILRRTNRLHITDSGYLHEQDNQKIIRKGNADQLLVEEKGQNIYKRIADKECAAAKAYWQKNQAYWSRVRHIWNQYLSAHTVIKLHTKVEGKMLHEYLLDLEKEMAEKKTGQEETDKRISDEINRFIIRDPDAQN